MSRSIPLRAGAVGVILALLLPSAVLATPVGTLDVDQGAEDGMTLDTYQGPIGQVFTAGLSGDLTTVSLYVDKTGSLMVDPLVVEIHDMDSGSTLMATTSIAAGDISGDGPGWVDAVFSTPAAITAGHDYEIVIPVVGDQSLGYEVYATDGAPSGFAEATLGPEPFFGTIAFRTYVTATPTPTPTPSVTIPPTSTVSPAAPSAPGSGTTMLLIAILALTTTVVAVGTRRRRA